MKKFNYYLYYKYGCFILLNRNDNTYNKFISFRGVYVFLREHAIQFSDVYLKRTSLSDLFRHYCTFKSDDELNKKRR